MDLLTPAEVRALVADAYDEAEAMSGTPGQAEAVAVAQAFEALALAWDASLRPALAELAAVALDADGDGTVTAQEAAALSDAAAAVVAVVSGGFAARALGPFLAAVLDTYGRAAGEIGDGLARGLPVLASGGTLPARSGGARVVQGLGGPDLRAAYWLERHETYWVTRYGTRIVEPRIARIIGAEAMDRGQIFEGGRREAARRLRDALGAEYRDGLAYWRLVATSAAVRSGSLGRVAALEAAGMDGRIDATIDRKTTQVCRYLDGKRVPLADLVAWRDRLLSLTDPEAIVKADRWWKDSELPQIRAMVGSNGGAVPSALGPPGYHAHCRSVIVADV